jgi:hypothetical protein
VLAMLMGEKEIALGALGMLITLSQSNPPPPP